MLVTRRVAAATLFEVVNTIDRDRAARQLAAFLAALHHPATSADDALDATDAADRRHPPAPTWYSVAFAVCVDSFEQGCIRVDEQFEHAVPVDPVGLAGRVDPREQDGMHRSGRLHGSAARGPLPAAVGRGGVPKPRRG